MEAPDLFFETRPILEANLSQLKENLRRSETPTHEPALSSIEIFSKLPIEKQRMILSNISTAVRILGQQYDPDTYSRRDQEVARLKSAIKSFNLKVMTNSVFDVVSTDDVIEVYTIEGVQLYRNMRFFKMCSYNLLDLAVNPWESLYDKPRHVLEQTHKTIEKMFQSNGRPVSYEMEPFLQKEKWQYAASLKTTKVTPRYLVPLFDQSTDRLAGAFSTNSGEIIAEGMQSSRFSTL